MPRIFDSKYPKGYIDVDHINGYLLPGPDIYVKPRSLPLSRAVPQMITGNRPADSGNLILSEEEKNFFIEKYPQDKKFIRQLLGAEEFIHNKKRYCLWLVDATPDDIRKNKFIYDRVKKCRDDRLRGAPDRQKLAETPHLFRETKNPKHYVLIPETSSERRKYIPMGFLDENFIPLNSTHIIPDAEIWHFGILTSNVHMIWTKTVCGRLKSDYRYSEKIVYNNFVWMKMEFIDYAELILAAKKILEVRKKYLGDRNQGLGASENEKSKTNPYPLNPSSSLADLYDDVTMPCDLRDAHKNLDKIVMKIYNLDENMTEEEIAIELLEHYKFVTDYLRENKMKQLTRQNSDDDDEDFEEE